MAGRNKTENGFPIWEPRYRTAEKFDTIDKRKRYVALRNSSSGFIARSDVREFLIKKYNNKCASCKSGDNLTIDHINSVYAAAINLYPIDKLNTEDNLQILCGRCNSAKVP